MKGMVGKAVAFIAFLGWVQVQYGAQDLAAEAQFVIQWDRCLRGGQSVNFWECADGTDWMLDSLERGEVPEDFFVSNVSDFGRMLTYPDWHNIFQRLNPIVLILLLQANAMKVTDTNFERETLLEQIGSLVGPYGYPFEIVEVLLAFGANPRRAWGDIKKKIVEEFMLFHQWVSTLEDGALRVDLVNLRLLYRLCQQYGDTALDHYVLQPLTLVPFKWTPPLRGVLPPDFNREDKEKKMSKYNRLAKLVLAQVDKLTTPLHIAAQLGDRDQVENLLRIRKNAMQQQQANTPKAQKQTASGEQRGTLTQSMWAIVLESRGVTCQSAAAHSTTIQRLRGVMREQRAALLDRLEEQRKKDLKK